MWWSRSACRSVLGSLSLPGVAFPGPMIFFQGSKTQTPPQSISAVTSGIGTCWRGWCLHQETSGGTESAAFASLCLGPSMPSFILTAPLSLFQPGHRASSCPIKVQRVSDASFQEGEMMPTPPQGRANTQMKSLKCCVLQRTLKSPGFPSAAFNENSAWQPGPRRKCPGPP